MTVNLSLIVGHIRKLKKGGFCKSVCGGIDGGDAEIEAREMPFLRRVPLIPYYNRICIAEIRSGSGRARGREMPAGYLHVHRISTI